MVRNHEMILRESGQMYNSDHFGMIQEGQLSTVVLQLNIDLAELREDYIPFKVCSSQNLHLKYFAGWYGMNFWDVS